MVGLDYNNDTKYEIQKKRSRFTSVRERRKNKRGNIPCIHWGYLYQPVHRVPRDLIPHSRHLVLLLVPPAAVPVNNGNTNSNPNPIHALKRPE